MSNAQGHYYTVLRSDLRDGTMAGAMNGAACEAAGPCSMSCRVRLARSASYVLPGLDNLLVEVMD